MPLFKTIAVNSQTTVKVWKITESFDELLERNETALEYLHEQLARFKTE